MTKGQDYYRLIRRSGIDIVGVGVNAFNRIGLWQIDVGASLLCLVEGTEVELLRKRGEVVSVEGDLGEKIEKRNTEAVLKSKRALTYLRAKGKPGLLVYKSSKGIEEVCDREGFLLLANRAEVRDVYEDKDSFYRLGRKIGLPMIEGRQLRLGELDGDRLEQLKSRWGKWVIQLAEVTMGGGKGTYFIEGQRDFEDFKREMETAGMRSESKINVTRFVEGASPSITGCVTKHGVLTGVVQTQVVGVPFFEPSGVGKGKFQGHDWSFRHYEPWVQEQAEGIAERLGEHMQARGYRGIFGVDLLVDERGRKVYVVECNPRYTGAFPVYSMLQKATGEIPLDTFQLLEFLEIEYEMDFEEVNRSWKQPKEGAHLVLHNVEDEVVRVEGEMPAGVYKMDQGRLRRVRDGVAWEDIEHEDECLFTDGCPRRGTLVKPGARFGKLVFKHQVLEKPQVLTEYVREVVKSVYGAMEFRNLEMEEK